MSETGSILAELRCYAAVGLAPSVAQLVGQVAVEGGLPAARAGDAQLATEELFVNICSYAYPAGGGDIGLVVRVAAGRIEVELSDAGPPFDPLAVAPPALQDDLVDRPIGGLGLFLVKELTDQVAYRRRGGRNQITFAFALAQSGDET